MKVIASVLSIITLISFTSSQDISKSILLRNKGPLSLIGLSRETQPDNFSIAHTLTSIPQNTLSASGQLVSGLLTNVSNVKNSLLGPLFTQRNARILEKQNRVLSKDQSFLSKLKEVVSSQTDDNKESNPNARVAKNKMASSKSEEAADLANHLLATYTNGKLFINGIEFTGDLKKLNLKGPVPNSDVNNPTYYVEKSPYVLNFLKKNESDSSFPKP